MYYLVSMLKPEFDEYFVSGAMLCYEEMNIQHEDVGFVPFEMVLMVLKKIIRSYLLRKIYWNVIRNVGSAAYVCGMVVLLYSDADDSKNGLPLPVFIRGDDVEFSLTKSGKVYYHEWHLHLAYGIHL